MSVEGLANILLEEEPGITFTVLEIGARQIPGATDIEHLHIMENFPGSSYIGFEVDEDITAARRGMGSIKATKPA